MSKEKPFQLPEEGFSQEEETGFRNELTTVVEDISTDIGSVSSLSDMVASSSAKRQSLSVPSLGQLEVDENFQFLGPIETAGLAADSVTNLWNDVISASQYFGTYPIQQASRYVNESSSGFDAELTWTGQVYKTGASYASNSFAPYFRIDRYRNVGALAGGISSTGTTANFVTGPSDAYLEVDDPISFTSAYSQHTYHTVTVVNDDSVEFEFTPGVPFAIPTGTNIRKIDSTLLNVRGVPFGAADVKNEFSFSVQDESVPESTFYYRFMLSHDGNNIFQASRLDAEARASVKLVWR